MLLPVPEQSYVPPHTPEELGSPVMESNKANEDPLRGKLAQLPPYDHIDFKALAKIDKDFKQIWKKYNGHLDFQDPEALKTLTKAGLRVGFGLEIDLPDDRLCPPVPIRWNYVAWIQALIDSTAPNYADTYDPDRKVVGLDIGTGASAIYTLLCLKTRPNWTMCATDVDKKSFNSAARNLALNSMLTRTKMLQTMETNALIPLKFLGVEKLDFTICNPPFFADENDMRSSIKGEGKSWSPNAVCTGAEIEMVCPGGDLGFVTRMVNESLLLKESVAWYTSMLGKLSSAKAVVDLLKKHGVNNWAVGCLEPGSASKRWIVAWSFGDYRPRNNIARMERIANEYLPFPTEYKILLADEHDLATVKQTIYTQLSSLDLRWDWSSETSTGVGTASQNVWKRAYRRAHEKKSKATAAGIGAGDDEMRDTDVEATVKVALAFRIRVLDKPHKGIIIEWLRGTDQVLWESFCGLMHRNFKKT